MLRAWILRTSFILITLNSVLANEPPLRITILEEQGQVDVAKPFKVEITNLTEQPNRIYDPRSAEGYRALSLVFTHKKTKQQKIAGAIELVPNSERFRRYPKNISKPDLRALQLQSKTNTLVIGGRDKFHFYVFLSETVEAERPDVGQIGDWDLQVRYEPKANTEGVWTGRVNSLPADKLVCSGLTELKTAIRLSEPATLKLLDSDPSLLTRLGGQEILRLAISHNRAEIVRWAIKHKASPFHMVNKARLDSFLNCPAAKIETVDVLKVVWDEMPTRRDDLFVVLCEVAREEISSPFRIDKDQQRAKIQTLLRWGAKPTLFSAIYLGDTELVKSLLVDAKTLPEVRKFQDFGASSPLVWAVACERLETAEWLIDHFKLDVNADYKINGPLIAYAVGSAQVTELLCKHHASFKDNHPSGGYAGFFTWEVDPTAIDFAAAYGTPEVMEILLKNGGDLLFSPSEMHPLAIAAHEQNWPVLKLLATHPKFLELDEEARASILADVRKEEVTPHSRPTKDDEGKLDALAALGMSDNMLDSIQSKVRLLLESKGSRDDPRGDDARVIMEIAIEQKRIDLVVQLLDAGYEDEVDFAEFQHALTAGNSEALELFADRCKTEFERLKNELLRVAAARGDFVATKWLLARGANPDAVHERGANARAAAKKYPKSITTAEVERLFQANKP